MTSISPFNRSILSLTLLTLTACSSSNSDYLADATAKTDAISHWQQPQENAEHVALLTDLIGLEELTQLVEQGLSSNPNLQQTALALQIAYAQRGITASSRIPQVNASFGGSKDEGQSDSFNADLSVSWELDLWQKLTDEVGAADADIATSRANFQGAKDLLAANIMRAWLQIQLQQQLLEIETERLVVLENNENFVLQRYRTGLGELKDLDSARSSSAKTRATLAEYQETLAKNQRELGVLLGKNNAVEQLNMLINTPTVLQPLAQLPEQDLAGRPDLQSAYAKVSAEQYRVDVAYKALLPSFNLTASLKDVASSPSSALFASPAWSLLGQISAPLFQGGKLREQIHVAELTAEQAFWAYQETLVNAVAEVENAITENTKAIVAVHYAGVPCDMEALSALAKNHNVALVEDAAQAIDVKYQDKYLGAWGDLATFSFHETKNVQCGEGGMLVVNNPDLKDRAEILLEKGTNRQAFFRGQVDKYRWVDLGSSFLLSELNAAYLWAQLEKVEDTMSKRKTICAQYANGLLPLKEKGFIDFPVVNLSPNGHLFYILLENPKQREALIHHLKCENILSVFHYQCLHKGPFYLKNHSEKTLGNAERFEDCLLRLPVYNGLTEMEIQRVIMTVLSFFNLNLTTT